MDQETYFVPKRTGTYADVLLAYGLATLLDRAASGVGKGRAFARPRITLMDAGPYYEIRLSEPVRAEEVPDGLFFRSPAPFLKRSSADTAPPDTPTRNVKETKEQVRAYQKMRSALREKGIRGSDLEGQLRDQEPPGDWTVVAFLGDGRMQALDAYNRIVAGWARSRDRVAEHIRTILRLFSTPEGDEEALRAWEKGAGKAIPKARETASQLLNPHQGKGLNEPKAYALRMDNVKDRPWLEEFLKAVGLWACMIPRQVVDTKDWKAYVLAPLRMDWRAHQDVMAQFRRYLWNERPRDETSLKSDITSLLLFVRAWLDYVEAAGRDDADFDADVTSLAPEKVVAGFHVAQFKPLSQRAYTMVNMSFLHLPQWTGTPQSWADILNVKGVINEHLAVIREIDETRSGGYNLLRAYRDFVAGNNWGAFFEFAAGYSHEIMRRYNEGAREVPTFSTSNLRRLIMAADKSLQQIIRRKGFQNVARAIRHSTIIPQSRKARGQDTLYEVRYGLGAELKRKATVRDEFVVALCDFMQSYNQETIQKLETTGKRDRDELFTTDIEEVVRLVDEYGSELVAGLLIAYGYAREPETKTDTNQE